MAEIESWRKGLEERALSCIKVIAQVSSTQPRAWATGSDAGITEAIHQLQAFGGDFTSLILSFLN